MPADNLLTLQASVSKTADFNSTGIDLKGTPRRGLFARIVVTAISNTVTYDPVIEHSDDDSTYTPIAGGTGYRLTGATGTVTNGVMHVKFETSKRYVRLASKVSGATVTYQADIVAARP